MEIHKHINNDRGGSKHIWLFGLYHRHNSVRMNPCEHIKICIKNCICILVLAYLLSPNKLKKILMSVQNENG